MMSRQWSWRTELTGAITIGGILLAAFFATQSASAGPLGIDPLVSPPPAGRTLTVSINCSEGWNPTCRPRAVSTLGLRVTSTFRIDSRTVGPANRTYSNVCARYRLRDGYHTALVNARDSRGNVASTGTQRAIRCDRTRPTATPGVRGVSAYPQASDALSGIAARRFYVDSNQRPWTNYSNLCATFRLRAGRHIASVKVTDLAGNTTITRRAFYCPIRR